MLGALTALLLVAPAATGQLESELTCPTNAELTAALARIVGTQPIASVRLRLEPGPESTAILTLRDERTGEENVRSIPRQGSCEAVADACALIVAAWLETLPWHGAAGVDASATPAIPFVAPAAPLIERREPAPAREATKEALTSSRPAPLTPPERPAKREAPVEPKREQETASDLLGPVDRDALEAAQWRYTLTLSGGGGAGLGKGGLAAYSAAAGLEAGEFLGISVGARVIGASGVRVQAAPGSVMVERYTALALARVDLVRSSAFTLLVRGGLGFDLVRASASGFSVSNGSETFAEPILALIPAVEWTPGGPVAFFGEVGLTAAGYRNGLQITGLGEVGAIPNLNLWGGAGVALHFF